MANIYDNDSQHFNESITFVYSSHSVDALKELIGSIVKTFKLDVDIEDICDYGVFCDINLYCNYHDIDTIAKDCDVPEQVANCIKYNFDERKNYVKETIERIIRGDIKKPKWMLYMEMYKSCNNYNDSPSTFLYLVPKETRYKPLCCAIVNFLYSPNLINKIANKINL